MIDVHIRSVYFLVQCPLSFRQRPVQACAPITWLFHEKTDERLPTQFSSLSTIDHGNSSFAFRCMYDATIVPDSLRIMPVVNEILVPQGDRL